MALDALPILVIIGGGGIGLATAHRLGSGHHILFASRSPSTISAGAESLKQAGHKVTTQQVDVTSYESVASLAKTAESLGGAIETVVLTSALSPTMGSAEMILAVDVVGTANYGPAHDPALSPALERHLATAPRTSLLENKELHELIAGAAAASEAYAGRGVQGESCRARDDGDEDAGGGDGGESRGGNTGDDEGASFQEGCDSGGGC
ncbi:uncharacterized protein N0V96_007391 [Colletotrichum fioriniae]|uniref:uncharacterized protein n=1 Tax=Colletotrichum fioriniae TaxID=710243 RepID=UPI0032DBD803|nr:hypothetical protein N0V96_007391 [Colletotrichum fioriniae]